MKLLKYLVLGILILAQSALAQEDRPTINVGSKPFTESYILAEIIAQKIENSGLAKVKRHYGLGGTGVLYNAIKAGEIDIYPEYTGTLTHAILKMPELEDFDLIQAEALNQGIEISESLGFNNSYGIAVLAETAEKLGLETIDDLEKLKGKSLAFSHEFLERGDGFMAMREFYGLAGLEAKSIEHALAYTALEQGSILATDVYLTDAKIERFDLKILKDNRSFFPKYEGILLAQGNFSKRFPKVWEELQSLVGSMDNPSMISLNAKAELDGESFSQIATEYLGGEASTQSGYWGQLIRLTYEHSLLVGISLLFSILVGVPLGLLAAYHKVVGQSVLTLSGLLQTIPSLALLAFLIPFFGIGLKPSLIALFLYGLLPIVRGTYSGIIGLDPKLREVGRALGLTGLERLRLIEVPMASIHILNGIKTSAIINVGTATLAALIGAGGYGSLILTGLSLNNNAIILKGAIPAAVMALVAHALFELLDRILIPKGLK